MSISNTAENEQNKTLLRALTAPKTVLRGAKGEAVGMRIDMDAD